MTVSLRIAIADDEPDIREYFQALLPRLGHTVVATAKNGEELVEQCRSTQPDLVITDYRMPIMDGVRAAELLYQERAVPVILISAHHYLMADGCADSHYLVGYLVKPVKQIDLENAIAEALVRFSERTAPQ